MKASASDIKELLGRRINQAEVKQIAHWAIEDTRRADFLYQLATDEESGRVGVNALWCLTHLLKTDSSSLQSRQDSLIDMLLAETHLGRKRMLLQILRELSYNPETLRTDFLDFCLMKINSECEPYAIRAFSIYCAFKMCRFYPELTAELSERLDMLEQQSELSPGLKSALRTTRQQINRLAH